VDNARENSLTNLGRKVSLTFDFVVQQLPVTMVPFCFYAQLRVV